MPKKAFPLSKVYSLLEPGPVVLLTTARHGKPNVMAMSWHSMLEFEPPLIGCVVSNRNHSFELLRASKECAINIPTVEIAKQVVKAWVDPLLRSGKTIHHIGYDKFMVAGETIQLRSRMR